MPAEKYSASMDDVLLGDARAHSEAQGLTLSAWLADAAADRLRLEALHRQVAEWEAEHGAISVDERTGPGTRQAPRSVTPPCAPHRLGP